VLRIFHWGPRLKSRKSTPNFPRPRTGSDSYEGQQAPSHQLGGLGSAVSSHSGVRGGAMTAQRFSTILSTQDGLSWHYNIVKCGLSCSHWRAQEPCPPPRLAYALWLNPTPIYWTIYSPDLYLYRCCIGLGVYLLPYFYYVMLTYMPRKSFPVWMNEWLNASASTFYSSSTFWLYSAVPVVNKYFPPFSDHFFYWCFDTLDFCFFFLWKTD